MAPIRKEPIVEPEETTVPPDQLKAAVKEINSKIVGKYSRDLLSTYFDIRNQIGPVKSHPLLSGRMILASRVKMLESCLLAFLDELDPAGRHAHSSQAESSKRQAEEFDHNSGKHFTSSKRGRADQGEHQQQAKKRKKLKHEEGTKNAMLSEKFEDPTTSKDRTVTAVEQHELNAPVVKKEVVNQEHE